MLSDFLGPLYRKENPGFDAILGNPPYISTQSSSGFAYRNGLEFLFNFVDDLYVHFVFQGFNLLKKGGMFGFIISDTFFTLGTKQRLRELFQNNRLHRLGQCDPFKATVDAAIFVAEKARSRENDELFFIQARYKTDKSKPETELINIIKGMPEFKEGETAFKCDSKEYPVYHSIQGCLRLHRTSIDPYKKALKNAFFEPTDAIVRLYNRFIEPMNRLVDEWWEKIETSKKFAQHKEEILKYHKTLKPGDITLVGLIAEGGQGLATGNNGRFLGYLEGTEKANKIIERRKELMAKWNKHAQIGPVFEKLLKENDDDFESIVEPLKEQFDQYRELGLKKGEIYRIVNQSVILNLYAWDESTRQKVIYEGLTGTQTWVPFRKGDPEGNKWTNDEQLFICWSKDNVKYLSTSSDARWQGQDFFLKAGVAWTRGANHTCIKARVQEPCIYDVGGMQISPLPNTGVSHLSLLSIFNSNIFSFILKKFVAHTWMVQINDIRQMPIIVPSTTQVSELEIIAQKAIEAKELTFKKAQPSKELIDFCQGLADKQKFAPEYLQLPKQLKLINTADDCLNIIKLAVRWAVEKLYGVEGYGPFNEF